MRKKVKYTAASVGERAGSLLVATGPVLARLLHERVEQRRVLTRLRMPLHPDDEPLRRVFDPFERAVGRPGRLDETVADATERLMMVRGDARGGTDDPAEF